MIGMGLILNDRASAKSNAATLTMALRAGGVTKLPVGTLYIDGTIETRPIVGCGKIITDASMGYPVGGHPTLTGALTRVVQLGRGPSLRLSGTGFVIDEPIEWVGNGTDSIIEVEGRANPATGRHRFRNQVFVDAGAAVKCLAGYYGTNGLFVEDENHADNSIMDGCEAFNCDRLFWSCNQQAVGWKIRDPIVNNLGTKDCCVADIERGGLPLITGLVINHPRCTIFRIRDYSPNTCRLICRDAFRDRCPEADFPGNYLRLVQHTGNQLGSWDIEISVNVLTHYAPLDVTKLYDVTDQLPRDKWKIDIHGLPKDKD